MAKVKFGQGVADLRGKVGGSVFSRNASGAYLREKVSPVNPLSPKQIAIRSLLSDNSKLWASLTSVQREAWEALARAYPRTDVFGNSVSLTGIAQFQACNLVLSQCESTNLTVAPSDLEVEEVALSSALVISVATRQLAFSVDNDPGLNPRQVYVNLTRAHSPGKRFVKNLFRFLIHEEVGSPGPSSFTFDIPADFGNVVLGDTMTAWVRLANTTNGALSQGVLRTITITA